MVTAASLNNNAQKYLKTLLLIPFLGLNDHVLKHMTFYGNIPWKQIVGQLLGSYELRPHDGNVNLQGTATTKARELEIMIGDVISDENPEDLRKSLLGAFMLDNSKPNKHPMELQIMALIQKKLAQKLASPVWKGVRNAAGTTTMDLFNGLDRITQLEIIAAAISTANKNLIDGIGTITNANAVDKLRAFFLATDEIWRETPSKLFISYDIYNKYQQNMIDDGYSLQSAGDRDAFKYLLGSDKMVELVPQLGKTGSHYITLTRAENCQVGSDIGSDQAQILVKEIDNPFKTRFVTKMGMGVQFASIEKENLVIGRYALS